MLKKEKEIRNTLVSHL